MPFEHLVTEAVAFVQTYEVWAAPLCFVLAFGESLLVLSLLLPATALLLAIGTLIGASGIGFLPIWLAAAFGAALGDAVSYWIGLHFDERIGRTWPLSRSPTLLPRGRAFFGRWGMASIFVGRFIGPLRATIPLVAGLCAMPHGRFQFANFASALLWAGVMLAPGTFSIRWFGPLLGLGAMA